MNGDFVGTWSNQSHMGETLQYDEDWVRSERGRPLSISLPFTVSNRPHRGDLVRNYFENLLPDSQQIRDRVARRFQVGSTNAFALLAEIGRDCVGALQILPLGEAPAKLISVDATQLSDAQVARRLRGVSDPSLHSEPAHDDDDCRISIAGAQEKTALLHTGGQWYVPHGSTPTTHILKLPLGLVGNLRLDLSESVENEWLCMQILAAYGMPVARTQMLTFEDVKVLAVERFDRQWATHSDGNRWIVRLPQEDMCQVTGTAPHLKYESDGGPGIDRIMNVLATSRQSTRDVRTFFQAQVLFWMLCATDGHAKNFSLALGRGGAYELTPLYDVLSAYPFLGEGPGKLSPFRAKMAMAVRSKNAHWRMRDIQRRHWLSLGIRHGVLAPDGEDTSSVLDDLILRTPEVVCAVRSNLPEGFPSMLANRVLVGLNAAAEKLQG